MRRGFFYLLHYIYMSPAVALKLDDLLSSFKLDNKIKMDAPNSPKSVSSSNSNDTASRMKPSFVIIIVLSLILALFIFRDLKTYLNNNRCTPVWGLLFNRLNDDKNDDEVDDKNDDNNKENMNRNQKKRDSRKAITVKRPKQIDDDFDILEIDDEYFTPI